MSETAHAHTPGPWFAEAGRFVIGIGPEADVVDEVVADVAWSDSDFPTEKDWANAHLIAAAPEMLDALKAMDAAMCDGFDTQSARMAARKALIATRAAIAKAEGRS